MDALLLAIRSILSWAWDIFSINIPVLNVPFWIIAITVTKPINITVTNHGDEIETTRISQLCRT